MEIIVPNMSRESDDDDGEPVELVAVHSSGPVPVDLAKRMLKPERSQEHGRYLLHLTVSGTPVKGTRDQYQATLRFYEMRGHSPGINDVSLYVCEYCFGLIQPELLGLPVCMHCGKPIRRGQDEGPLFEQVFSDTLANIAATVANHFRMICQGNADILVRRSKHDDKVSSLRRLASPGHDYTKMEHDRLIRHVLASKETVAYSLGRINQDTAAGKPLGTAILDMLRA